MPAYSQQPFFASQRKIILRNCGFIDPTSLEEYVAGAATTVLASALAEFAPQQVIDEVTHSGLRGRGGGGFPTGPQVAGSP